VWEHVAVLAFAAVGVELRMGAGAVGIQHNRRLTGGSRGAGVAASGGGQVFAGAMIYR
jgi:hypothetical protein